MFYETHGNVLALSLCERDIPLKLDNKLLARVTCIY